MTATEIAAALGGARRSGQWWRCVCPVHGSRTGRSLTRALRDGDRCGLIAVCHAGCSRADILTELRRRGLLEDAPHYGRCPAPAIDRTDDRDDPARRIALARRIWDGAQDALGTEVVQYLSGRTLDIEPPACLRWAPRCWHREARTELPAMLARVDGADGALVGVHRTYLWLDKCGQWERRDRASLGPIGGGAPRRRDRDDPRRDDCHRTAWLGGAIDLGHDGARATADRAHGHHCRRS